MSDTEPEKKDPESFVLRAKPRKIVRLRRPVIIGVCAVGAMGLSGVIWLGLHPVRLLPPSKSREDRPVQATPPPADVFGVKARTYADVPKLGPPLPGDLGRPILERERAEAAAGATASSATAPVFFTVATSLADSTVAPDEAGSGIRDGARQATAISAVNRSASGASRPDPPDLAQTPKMAPTKPVLLAGSVLPASLLTAVNSDTPGLVVAQITADVRDSLTGAQVLIPRGARLLGRYDSQLAYGQTRLKVVWTRLVMPDGVSLTLDDEPATDAQGAGGVSDQINRHGGQLVGAAGVSALLALAAQPADGASDTGAAWALRNALQQTQSQVGQLYVARQMNVQPTLSIRAGERVYLVLQTDISVPMPAKGD
ncbi:MAG TPA: TrbI/VirB10 family protein [Asticcacaulis sp.]|nr:TrbI/VirB10 family protein [Asticcacaulis sp.]